LTLTNADVMFAASVTHVIWRAKFVIRKAKIADTKMLRKGVQ
jgi:hypothetical protein